MKSIQFLCILRIFYDDCNLDCYISNNKYILLTKITQFYDDGILSLLLQNCTIKFWIKYVFQTLREWIISKNEFCYSLVNSLVNSGDQHFS